MVLRRTKAQPEIKAQLALGGIHMTNKTDIIVFCSLTPLQRRAYLRLVESPDFQLLMRAEEACDCGSGARRCAAPVFRFCFRGSGASAALRQRCHRRRAALHLRRANRLVMCSPLGVSVTGKSKLDPG